jgi:excisionase family DNA binding protein
MAGSAAVTKNVEWLSTTETARRLGVHLRSVYRLHRRGEAVNVPLGRVIRVKDADLGAFIESCRITPGEFGRPSDTA